MGSIMNLQVLWKPDESNSSKLGVIDGQQRLTTIFLLTKVIYDTCEDERLKKRLFNILVDDYKNENRLVPINNIEQLKYIFNICIFLMSKTIFMKVNILYTRVSTKEQA